MLTGVYNWCHLPPKCILENFPQLFFLLLILLPMQTENIVFVTHQPLKEREDFSCLDVDNKNSGPKLSLSFHNKNE